jgi:hypothetical protein
MCKYVVYILIHILFSISLYTPLHYNDIVIILCIIMNTVTKTLSGKKIFLMTAVRCVVFQFSSFISYTYTIYTYSMNGYTKPHEQYILNDSEREDLAPHCLRDRDGLFGHRHEGLGVLRLRKERAPDDGIAGDGAAEVAAVVAAVGPVEITARHEYIHERRLVGHHDHVLLPEAHDAIALDATAHERGVHHLELGLVGADASFA